MKAVPDQIARWVPSARSRRSAPTASAASDTREALRRHFEVAAEQIAYAALHGLCRVGESTPDELRAALETLEIDPDRPNPVGA